MLAQTQLPVVVDDVPPGWLTRGCPRFAVVAASTFLRAPSSGDAMPSLPLLLASCLATLVSAGGGADLHPAPAPLGLWWHAPVLSGGGYGSEANALLVGLAGLGADAPPSARRTTATPSTPTSSAACPRRLATSWTPSCARAAPPPRTRRRVPLRARRVGPRDVSTSPCPPAGTRRTTTRTSSGARCSRRTGSTRRTSSARTRCARCGCRPRGARTCSRAACGARRSASSRRWTSPRSDRPNSRSNAFEHFENVASIGDAFGRPFDLVASSRRLIGPPPSSRRAGLGAPTARAGDRS